MAKLTMGEHKFIKMNKVIKQRQGNNLERDVRVIVVQREEPHEITPDVFGRNNSYDPWTGVNSRAASKRAQFDANIIIGDIGISMSLQEAVNLANHLNNAIGGVLMEVGA
jgi:hypothetical protein